uniref:Iodothyronine deiodinase n=1 Tax=Sinocyclocheilus anshuiensis TaxID=1608454 RepID=A0A671MG29_9TELE
SLSLSLSLLQTGELTGGNPLHVRRRHGCGGVLFSIQILPRPIKSGSRSSEERERERERERMFTLESLRAVWYGHKLDFFKTAHLGGAAPNTEVVPLDSAQRSGAQRILDYARGRRPLILNFGSCS